MLKKVVGVLSSRLVITTALIVIGLVMIVAYGLRTVRSYQQIRYIQEQGFDMGTADLEAIRPWMTIHFIAAAYGVPEEYIYAELGVTDPNRRRPAVDIGRLAGELGLGPQPGGGSAPIIDRLREIIEAYRANPVATGLNDVRGWMSIEYIANSTGVPTETIVEEAGLENATSLYKPLAVLADELDYPGGPRGLEDAIRDVLTLHGVRTR